MPPPPLLPMKKASSGENKDGLLIYTYEDFQKTGPFVVSTTYAQALKRASEHFNWLMSKGVTSYGC